jgi:predicted enzyme related to lactoylglutathione lyase
VGNPVVHFDIRSEHPEELWSFYGEVFGWIVHPDPQGGCALASTQSAMGIGGGIGRSDGEGPGVMLYIEVPDIDAALREIELHGGKVVTPRTPSPVVTLARFEDPQGNTVGLIEGVGASSQNGSRPG